jgi:hypothetical protein
MMDWKEEDIVFSDQFSVISLVRRSSSPNACAEFIEAILRAYRDRARGLYLRGKEKTTAREEGLLSENGVHGEWVEIVLQGLEVTLLTYTVIIIFLLTKSCQSIY